MPIEIPDDLPLLTLVSYSAMWREEAALAKTFDEAATLMRQMETRLMEMRGKIAELRAEVKRQVRKQEEEPF